MLEARPGSHCHACGNPYAPDQMTPVVVHRHCSECGTTAWRNPIPIAVQLQTVWNDLDFSRGSMLQLGVLIGQRGIQPKLGEWGLPGGFCELTDLTYEEGADREKSEEVKFTKVLNEQVLRPRHQLLGSLPGDPGQILAFSLAPTMIGLSTLESFVPCDECPAVRVAWKPEQLCFSSHTTALERWHPATAWNR